MTTTDTSTATAATAAVWNIDYDVSAEFLQRELEAAERALQHNEEQREKKRRKQQQQQQRVSDDSYSSADDEKQEQDNKSPLAQEQLSRLDRAASDLLLVQDISDWSKNARRLQKHQGKGMQQEEQQDDLFWTARCCEALGRLLVRHAAAAPSFDSPGETKDANTNKGTTTITTTSTTLLYDSLVQREYLPLYEYIYTTLILFLRQTLRSSGYPAKDACTQLLNQADDDVNDEFNGNNSSNSPSNNNIKSSSTFYILAETATCLLQLQRTHRRVVEHVLPKLPPPQPQSQQSSFRHDENNSVVLMELMRPIVDRVRYHFVQVSSSSSSNNASTYSNDKADVTFARIDRLPEWLLHYLQDTIFGQGSSSVAGAADNDSPFDVVTSLALYIQSNKNKNNIDADAAAAAADKAYADDLVLDFMNEVVRLVQWVFTARGFFQHASVAGRHSKPIILMNAIQQFIQFDALLRSQLLQVAPPTLAAAAAAAAAGRRYTHHHQRLLSLMDIFVAGNDELCTWWLERERESLYYTLFNDDDDNDKNDNKSTSTSRLLTRISPRTEIFCALIQSVQQKALQFNHHFSMIPYMQHVATPLCIQFLDAIHEKANALKSTLSTKPSRHASLSEANEQMENCIRDWMELINGTHLCATTILLNRTGGGGSSDGNNDNQGDGYSTAAAAAASGGGGLYRTDPDLERIGKSLQHVETVLCEEFCCLFVETVLLERAKLAVYLMKCSHILCSADNHSIAGDDMIEVSHDLQESWRLLTLFLQVCDEPEQDGPPFPLRQQEDEYSNNNNGHALACHAPRRLRHGVLDLLSEKFLDVALDPHEISSPDILQAGCRIFQSDMQAYFGFIPSPERVPKSCLRLLNVAQIMATPSPTLAALGNALVELVQESPPLHVESFTVDEQLYNQAMSMIHAKGWVWIEDLNDVLSILNRRRDLLNSEAF